METRWLGRVAYDEALAVQRALFASSSDYLLLLEHPPTYTLGVRSNLHNFRTEPAALEARGAAVTLTDRGGDITYHGPGQLVGYPILTVAGKRSGGMADTVAYVNTIQAILIDALRAVGLDDVGTLRRHPGVWVGPTSDRPRKIAAIGVKLSRGRSMHGFALNVTDAPLEWFEHIVACGITDKSVTSLQSEGIDVSMREVVDAVAEQAARRWGAGARHDVVWRETPEDLAPFSRAAPGGRAPVRLLARLDQAGVETGAGLAVNARKPEWLRVKANMGNDFMALKRSVRELGLVTVCEEAGCPNIHECWNDGTATFMVLGERCTRACGFCLVDTRRPLEPAADEPHRVAEAVARMGLAHTVLTMVARDDLSDGGAAHVAGCIEAIRGRCPTTRIEVLISDLRGLGAALDVILEAKPDVLNHNLETVARLQRAVRPSAGYARSLGVLARAGARGATTKSGVMVGLGETTDEVRGALRDLRAVGVQVLTIGQYLRPTAGHLPVARWWTPDEFTGLREYGLGLGFAHVEASPLTRSSYHARQGAEAAAAG